MKKSILNLGKILSSNKQKRITGGLISRCGNYVGDTGAYCFTNSDCDEGVCHNKCCNTAV